MKKLEKHYLNIFRKEKDDFRLNSLLGLVIKFIPKKAKVLDLGCGSGFFACAIAEKGNKVIAIDPSKEMVKMATQRKKVKSLGNNLQIIRMGAEEVLKLQKKFDVVLILDVLEHIRHEQKIIAKLKKIMSPKGKIIISVPAHPYLFGRRDKKMGHYRRYSKKMIKHLLEKDGLRIRIIHYWNFFGYFFYLFNEKILKRAIDEKIRYRQDKKANFIKKIIYHELVLENKIHPLIGLTLIVIAENE